MDDRYPLTDPLHLSHWREWVVSHIYVKGLGDLSLLVQLLLHVKLYHTCVHCQYIVGVFLLYANCVR